MNKTHDKELIFERHKWTTQSIAHQRTKRIKHRSLEQAPMSAEIKYLILIKLKFTYKTIQTTTIENITYV